MAVGRPTWFIDPVLSALLLNWATDGLDASTLVGVLNPTANTEGTNESFPYLVDANGG